VKAQLREYDNPLLDLQLRPIKPVVQEARPISELFSEMSRVPSAHARGSTKPEPGLKRRALLAVDDCTAFVAGYASHNVETVMKTDGMVLRQDPADVSEWVNFDIGADVWRVSNDYTNFNILNSLRSMQLIDIVFARAWQGVKDRYAVDKVRACLWVAASYRHASMTTPAGTHTVTNGLWSGHRNTARDNTMLHVVYLNCVHSVQRALFGELATSSKQRICGDDETLSYTHWHVAICHTLVADALGYASQVSKGLLSRRHDEFLQLMRMPGCPPTYPVANTILTFCSGNWYKDPVRDLGSTVKDVSDHLWDMHLGGVPLICCQELGVKVLDYLMQVKDDDGNLVELEWWAFRGSGLPEGHPLWGCEPTEACPLVEITTGLRNLPAHATDASIQSESKIWDVIGREAEGRVRASRMNQSYRHVAKTALTREYDANVASVWARRSRVFHEMPTLVPPPVPANRWRSIPVRGLERSARAVAIKVKFPPELLDEEEMWRAMTVLEPRDRSAMLQGLAERQKPTRSWRWYLPPLLRVA
jgi:hypothetical protein